MEKNEKETSRVASSPNGGLDNEFVPTAVTWQPVLRSVNDGYQGWSSPIELDNIRTDISINAGESGSTDHTQEGYQKGTAFEVIVIDIFWG